MSETKSHHYEHAADLSALLASKYGVWRRLDPSMDLEVKWLKEMGGRKGMERTQQLVLEQLSSDTSHPSLADALSQVGSIRNHNVVTFVGQGAVMIVDSVCKIIEKLCRGISLDLGAFEGSVFLRDVAAKMKPFIEFNAGLPNTTKTTDAKTRTRTPTTRARKLKAPNPVHPAPVPQTLRCDCSRSPRPI